MRMLIMRTLIMAAALSATLILASLKAAGRVVERNTERTRMLAEVLPAQFFTPDNVLNRFDRIFREQASKIVFGRYDLFSSEEDLWDYVDGKGRTDVTYRVWQNMYKRMYSSGGSRQRPIAELIILNKKASIRIRNVDGSLISKTIAPPDPLRLVVKGVSCELLYLDSGSGYDPQDVVSGKHEWMSLYVKTGRTVSVDEARSLASALISWTGIDHLTVNIRSDVWFIYDESFPALYWFGANETPPTEAELLHLPQLRCVVTSGRVDCH
jgi:hypothetical protein